MRPFRNWSIRRKAGLHLLFILLLVAAHLGGVWVFLQEQEQDGTAINEAGEQRMLTQKMVWEAHKIGMGYDGKRSDLAASAAEFDRTLTDLIEGNATRGISPAPPAVREQLLVVRSMWVPYYDHIRTILEEPRASSAFDVSLAYLESNTEQLRVESSRAVQRYERAYEAKVERLQLFLLGLLVVDLFAIPSLFLLIKRRLIEPIRQLTAETTAVADGDLDQRITTVDSGDEVGILSRSVHGMKDQLISTIRESERFKQAVEHTGHAIYITDTGGTIEYVNPAFEETTHYQEAQALGKTPRILKSGYQAESYYEELWETILAGEVWEETIVNRRASGELFHAHQTVAPITDANGELTGFVAAMTDNTEEIVNLQQNEVLSRVLRHNLRTELNLIDGFAQELGKADGTDTQTEYVDRIHDSVAKLVELSDVAGRCVRMFRRETYRNPQEIRSAIERACATVEEQYPEATVTTDVPGYEIDVPANLEVVVEELLTNAIKHNDQASPEVTVTATLQKDTNAQPAVQVDVADNGPGLPTVEQQVLENGEETPLLHGSGLGLWLVYWVVTLAGGDVSITDRSPRGTRVTLSLPRASVRAFPDDSTGGGTDATAAEHDPDHTTHDQ